MTEMTNWVRIERTFNAPIEVVWRMWTEAGAFEQWYGPGGMSVTVCEMNAVVGGRRKIKMAMQTPERSMTMWFVGEFEVVEAPSRLVYTEAMADEAGAVIPPAQMGMPEGAPESTKVVVELSEADGVTHMVMTHVGVPADSPGAGGWAHAIDALAAVLAGA